jgi:hypothetical protein
MASLHRGVAPSCLRETRRASRPPSGVGVASRRAVLQDAAALRQNAAAYQCPSPPRLCARRGGRRRAVALRLQPFRARVNSDFSIRPLHKFQGTRYLACVNGYSEVMRLPVRPSFMTPLRGSSRPSRR